MDPLEAGERVLNGVIHNDLFILTPPRIHAGNPAALRAQCCSRSRRRTHRQPGRACAVRPGCCTLRHLSARDRAPERKAQLVPQRDSRERELHDSKQSSRAHRRNFSAAPWDRRRFLLAWPWGSPEGCRRAGVRPPRVASAPAASGPPARPPLPPEPSVSQPPPLKRPQGQGRLHHRGLRRHRAWYRARRLQCRDEGRDRLPQRGATQGGAAAVQARQCRVSWPFKHDVTDRDGWKAACSRQSRAVRQAASGGQQRRHQDAATGEPGEIR